MIAFIAFFLWLKNNHYFKTEVRYGMVNNMKNQQEYWSDYWRNDGKHGEVFVNSEGKKPDYIREFWRVNLHPVIEAAQGSANVVLDLACGAGSIFEDLEQSNYDQVQLIASDISQSALDIVSTRVPEAKVVCCSCTDLPFEDGSINTIVSQFGIEYAGIDAFKEAANKLANDGQLVFLSHYKNGYIDQRNQRFLEGAKLAIDSGFIDAAMSLVDATYSSSPSKLRQAKDNFKVAEKPLANSFKTNPEGIHNHLYFGFRQLYLKHQSYTKSDIEGWLQSMRADIKKSIIKVSEICKVSLNDDDINQVRNTLSEAKLNDIDISTLCIPNTQDVIAWVIKASK